MGRRPNPVIAANFTRGQKHGQTTNRYAQTCNHCSLFFPTGRPETLYGHLASCSSLTQGERAEAIAEIYNTSSTAALNQSSMAIDQHHVFQSNDDFDITGLNVLAGVAENAEDMILDPQIAASGPTEHAPADVHNISHIYGSHPANSFVQTTTTGNTWSYPFQTVRDSPSPYSELPNVPGPLPNFSIADLPGSQWSFAPIITTPATYVALPTHHTPVVFAEPSDNELQDGVDDAEAIRVPPSPHVTARRIKEPYTESKRARVAEMRHVGACIRCSRLRKTCEPVRPCSACRGTASKTWTGGCTSLAKGQEFHTWFGPHFDNLHKALLQTNIGRSRRHTKVHGWIELRYLGENGPKISFDVSRIESGNSESVMAVELSEDAGHRLLMHEKEDVARVLFEYATEHQDIILDRIDIPALDLSARIAQGLSGQQEWNEENQIWGSCKQSDATLARIFQLWLTVTLCTTEQFQPTITVTDCDDASTGDGVLDASRPMILSQLDLGLETVVHQHKDELRRFDANILYQSYKYLFNLLIGMFLILDTVEKYCCYVRRKDVPSTDNEAMLEQAQALADKYAYCVQNIQMMPRFGFDTEGTMTVRESSGKIDHEMQRIWMADLCMSKHDLEQYLPREEEMEWIIPRGRLWARLFHRLSLN